MDTQITQIRSPQPSLFQDTSAQNQTDNSFQRYLDEEQKRLALFFTGWGQLNFDGFFNYTSSNSTQAKETDRSSADLEELLAQLKTTDNYQLTTDNKQLPTNRQTNRLADQQTTQQTMGQMLKELLNRSGWLSPNIEALPMFYRAQFEGKLLAKLDMQSLIDEIASRVEMVKDKGKVEFSMALKPEDMGEILLTLTAKSGMIAVQIAASEETRKMIEAGRKELESALKKARVSLAEIKIIRTEEAGQNA